MYRRYPYLDDWFAIFATKCNAIINDVISNASTGSRVKQSHPVFKVQMMAIINDAQGKIN
jgi:hypothetical protein